MGTISPICQLAADALRRAFGDPRRIEGDEQHWALRPNPAATAINILLNTSREFATVWVFDPYDRTDGVSSERVRTEADVHRIVAAIKARLANAASV